MDAYMEPMPTFLRRGHPDCKVGEVEPPKARQTSEAVTAARISRDAARIQASAKRRIAAKAKKARKEAEAKKKRDSIFPEHRY